MTLSVKTFAKGKDGKLIKAMVEGVSSYAEAIELMKKQTSTPRAMCLAHPAELSVQVEKAAA